MQQCSMGALLFLFCGEGTSFHPFLKIEPLKNLSYCVILLMFFREFVHIFPKEPTQIHELSSVFFWQQHLFFVSSDLQCSVFPMGEDSIAV